MRRGTLVAPFLAAALLLPATPAGAQKAERLIDGAGFTAIEWIFAMKDRDLFEAWSDHGEVGRLRGSVARFLDWPNVSGILVLYNAMHLRALEPDPRIREIEQNLAGAAFGDRFKGTHSGGAYILLLRYKNSDRTVVVGLRDGVFLIEDATGIGAVDIRGPGRSPVRPRSFHS